MINSKLKFGIDFVFVTLNKNNFKIPRVYWS